MKNITGSIALTVCLTTSSLYSAAYAQSFPQPPALPSFDVPALPVAPIDSVAQEASIFAAGDENIFDNPAIAPSEVLTVDALVGDDPTDVGELVNSAQAIDAVQGVIEQPVDDGVFVRADDDSLTIRDVLEGEANIPAPPPGELTLDALSGDGFVDQARDEDESFGRLAPPPPPSLPPVPVEQEAQRVAEAPEGSEQDEIDQELEAAIARAQGDGVDKDTELSDGSVPKGGSFRAVIPSLIDAFNLNGTPKEPGKKTLKEPRSRDRSVDLPAFLKARDFSGENSHIPAVILHDEIDRLFVYAASVGDIQRVRILVDAGRNIDAKNEAGITPLLAAINKNKHAMVNYLIARGANVNIANRKGITPLHMAVQTRNATLLNALIASGARVNAQSQTGLSPLMLAINLGQYRLAERLINAGADVNSQNHEGYSPLHMASYNGRVDLAKLLLANGAKAKARSGAGLSVSDVAQISVPSVAPQIATLLSDATEAQRQRAIKKLQAPLELPTVPYAILDKKEKQIWDQWFREWVEADKEFESLSPEEKYLWNKRRTLLATVFEEQFTSPIAQEREAIAKHLAKWEAVKEVPVTHEVDRATQVVEISPEDVMEPKAVVKAPMDEREIEAVLNTESADSVEVVSLNDDGSTAQEIVELLEQDDTSDDTQYEDQYRIATSEHAVIEAIDAFESLLRSYGDLDDAEKLQAQQDSERILEKIEVEYPEAFAALPEELRQRFIADVEYWVDITAQEIVQEDATENAIETVEIPDDISEPEDEISAESIELSELIERDNFDAEFVKVEQEPWELAIDVDEAPQDAVVQDEVSDIQEVIEATAITIDDIDRAQLDVQPPALPGLPTLPSEVDAQQTSGFDDEQEEGLHDPEHVIEIVADDEVLVDTSPEAVETVEIDIPTQHVPVDQAGDELVETFDLEPPITLYEPEKQSLELEIVQGEVTPEDSGPGDLVIEEGDVQESALQELSDQAHDALPDFVEGEEPELSDLALQQELEASQSAFDVDEILAEEGIEPVEIVVNDSELDAPLTQDLAEEESYDFDEEFPEEVEADITVSESVLDIVSDEVDTGAEPQALAELVEPQGDEIDPQFVEGKGLEAAQDEISSEAVLAQAEAILQQPEEQWVIETDEPQSVEEKANEILERVIQQQKQEQLAGIPSGESDGGVSEGAEIVDVQDFTIPAVRSLVREGEIVIDDGSAESRLPWLHASQVVDPSYTEEEVDSISNLIARIRKSPGELDEMKRLAEEQLRLIEKLESVEDEPSLDEVEHEIVLQDALTDTYEISPEDDITVDVLKTPSSIEIEVEIATPESRARDSVIEQDGVVAQDTLPGEVEEEVFVTSEVVIDVFDSEHTADETIEETEMAVEIPEVSTPELELYEAQDVSEPSRTESEQEEEIVIQENVFSVLDEVETPVMADDAIVDPAAPLEGETRHDETVVVEVPSQEEAILYIEEGSVELPPIPGVVEDPTSFEPIIEDDRSETEIIIEGHNLDIVLDSDAVSDATLDEENIGELTVEDEVEIEAQEADNVTDLTSEEVEDITVPDRFDGEIYSPVGEGNNLRIIYFGDDSNEVPALPLGDQYYIVPGTALEKDDSKGW